MRSPPFTFPHVLFVLLASAACGRESQVPLEATPAATASTVASQSMTSSTPVTPGDETAAGEGQAPSSTMPSETLPQGENVGDDAQEQEISNLDTELTTAGSMTEEESDLSQMVAYSGGEMGNGEEAPFGGDDTRPEAPAEMEPVCGAPLPPGECVGVTPVEAIIAPNAPQTTMTIPGAPKPTWRLRDFQCLSCGLDQTYGLDSFDGAATLVALFNAGCGICQNQASRMEQMSFELEAAGRVAHFVALNSVRDINRQSSLTNRCSFPLLQDTDDVLAMEEMQGGIYDMYIYRPDGTLHVYLPGNSGLDTWLYPRDEDDADPSPGYENVKEALLSAMDGRPFVPPHPAPEPDEQTEAQE